MSKLNEAYLNHGRWIVNCPKCGTPNQIASGDREFICLVCYPELRAVAFKPKPSNPGLFVPVADQEERDRARARAHKNHENHAVHYQLDPQQVDKLMQNRRPQNRHWTTESLDELRAENKAHGVK